MKKSLIVLSLFTIFSLALIGCCPSQAATFTIGQIPWPDNEVTIYTIEDQNGNTMGNCNMTVVKENNTYLLSQDYNLIGEQYGQQVSVNVNATDLKPISGNEAVWTPNSTINITSSYSNSLVTVTATADGKKQSADFDIPDDAYDNDEVLFMLRTIPFEVGYSASYTNVVPSAGLTQKATITVVTQEEVSTPAGSFDCYKLNLSTTGAVIHLWYGVETPHYLVKYDNQTAILLLTQHP